MRFETIAALVIGCSMTLATPSILVSHALQAPESLEHDFGVVRQGGTITHTFAISMEVGETTIERVELGRQGMKARFSPRPPVDGQALVTLIWDTALASGTFEAQAVVHWSGGSRAPVTLKLVGTVRPAFEVKPSTTVFFSVYYGDGGEQTMTIVNRDETPLEIKGLKPAGTHFTASLRTIEPGQEYQIVVRVPPDTAPGRYLEALVVETNRDVRPRVTMGVNVFVKRDIYAFPEEANFGRVSLAAVRGNQSLVTLLTQTVLVSRRQGPFEIRSVKSDVHALRIKQDPASGPSEVFRFDLELDSSKLAPGPLNGSLRLETTDAAFPELVVPVRGEVR
jgi:hypothetical protein